MKRVIDSKFPLLHFSKNLTDPTKMATRYSSYHSSSSDLSECKPKAIVRSKKPCSNPGSGNITCMMKKLMEMNKSDSRSKKVELAIPIELKRTDSVKGGGKSTLGTLQRKLFGKDKPMALTEVKGNTRTLSMVLRSERELLTMNKDHELEIADLKRQLQDKNREVEKLKDLCLKQREEIRSLKSALLFPEAMQELDQSRQIIPNLQKQVVSLTGQLQCIAQDLAEVKANNYLSGSCHSQAQTSSYDSLEMSSSSPDRLLALEDLNPCLTPYIKRQPKAFVSVDSAEESLSGRSTITNTTGGKIRSSSQSVKLLRSSEGKAGRRSEESKGWYTSGRMF